METITFYSYKGGVGRTLMVANVAKYLARFGLKVFLLDFDLEAPGLHYKLFSDFKRDSNSIQCGLVDYIYSFNPGMEPPVNLADCVIDIMSDDGTGGWIKLMPAGNVPTREYWRRLARINWHDLFYGEDAQGIPFFLELQARIAEEYKPDFLVIDSRTGITEIGGVTTTVLADKVICLLLHNQENLEGAREVLRSIKAEPRIKGQSQVEIIPVITRLPEDINMNKENEILKGVKKYLNEPPENLADSLNLSDVFVVHSEPDLQVMEGVRFGSGKKYDESVILRDYLKIFEKFVDKDVLGKNLPQVINFLKKYFIDSSDRNQKALEEIALSYPKKEVIEELYRIYRMRNLSASYILERAYEWYRRGLSENEPVLWSIIKEQHNPLLNPKPVINCPLDFIEKVWKAAGKMDTKFENSLAKIREAHNRTTK